MNNILITGSSGTVGTAVAEALLDHGYNVRGLDTRPNRWSKRVDELTMTVDITDERLLPPKESFNPDLILHFAAHARVHKSVENPELALSNFNMTFKVAEYARQLNADLIFSSSREVYGNNTGIVSSEGNTQVDKCESPYTASKAGGEALVNSYGRCYDIDTAIVRFSNVYGRFDMSNRVIPLFIAQANRDDDLTVFGKDKVLDFTYLDDCVNGVLALIKQFHKATGETFNIASGHGSSLINVAEQIVEQTGSNSDILVQENRTGEVSRYIADVSKAERLLGFSTDYSLPEGIQSTVEWYEDHPELFNSILNQ